MDVFKYFSIDGINAQPLWSSMAYVNKNSGMIWQNHVMIKYMMSTGRKQDNL